MTSSDTEVVKGEQLAREIIERLCNSEQNIIVPNEAEDAIREIDDLVTTAHQRDQEIIRRLVAILELIAEQSERASLVQDRSAGIIKQVCALISLNARAALASAKQKEKDDEG